MTAHYPPQFVADARLFPGKVLGLELEQDPDGCPNCGGGGVMYAFYVLEGRQPVQRWNEQTQSWMRGETRGLPCPVCKGGERESYLRENCGLQNGELQVRLADFKPLEGKAEAKAVSLQLLALNMHPYGLVYFCGSYGRGKTTLLMGLVNGFRLIGVHSKYYEMRTLLKEIKSQYGESTDGAEVLLKRMQHVRVLALDELLDFSPTNWEKDTMKDLLNLRTRLQERVLTICAGTRSLQWLDDNEYGYLASRLRAGQVVTIGGADVRPTQGA